MIHAIQLLTVKKRFERSSQLRSRFKDAESYYDDILGRIVAELARSKVGEKAVLTAAKLYCEDWRLAAWKS